LQIQSSPLPLTKRHPLTISRGTTACSENLVVEVTHDGITGFGEMSPFNIGDVAATAVDAVADIEQWSPRLESVAPWEMQRVETVLDDLGGGRAARAALDIACHDWLGKRSGMPLYEILGGDPRRIAATSLTVGINPPDIARERTLELIHEMSPHTLKIKLGSPEGIDADQAMFEAVREAAGGLPLRVDANGGWDVADARHMIQWLSERGVDYVEQPLPRGQESDLPGIHWGSPLPIFADESCCVAADIPDLAGCVDGINLKLMKAGGIREGLRVIHTARAHGLLVMMGCMSECSLAIAASVHLSPLADYLDLDSHLNQNPDPYTGLEWRDGRVFPNDRPGLGVARLDVSARD